MNYLTQVGKTRVPSFKKGIGQIPGASLGLQAASTAASLWMNSIQLSHNADTATTLIVNRLAPMLQANLDAFNASPKSCADQAEAMSTYLTATNWLQSISACGNPNYGSAGNRCISDRFGPGGVTDTTGAKYPWAAYYYWPIVNDPAVSSCGSTISSLDPEAALNSSAANISNLVNGNNQVTVSGDFVSTTPSSSISSILPTSITSLFTGMTTNEWLLLGGIGIGLILVLKEI